MDAFGKYHPLITFAFFISAIVLDMCFRHPLFIIASFVFSCAYYIYLNKCKSTKTIIWTSILFCVITILNPVFNAKGNTVLFIYFGGRNFTLEALTYGAATAAMFVSMIFWFGCYHKIMTSDKFLFLFGRLASNLSLLLVMVLRLIPNYQSKINDLLKARVSLGKPVSQGKFKLRIINALLVLGNLFSWSFENGLTTADSMKSRGYGCGKRSSYSIYRFETRDKILFSLLLCLVVFSAIAGFVESSTVEYLPAIRVGSISLFGVIGFCAYCIMLGMPLFIDFREWYVWHSSILKIWVLPTQKQMNLR